MSEQLDFTEICRICLKKSKITFDIFDNKSTKRSLLFSEMLSSCTKLKPQETDGLPRRICKVCSKILKKTYLFNICCEKNDKKLREYLLRKNDKVHCNEQIKDLKSEAIHEIKLETNLTENIKTEDPTLANWDENRENGVKLEYNCNDNDKYTVWEAEDNLILNKIKPKTQIIEFNGNKDDSYDSVWEAEDDLILNKIKPKRHITGLELIDDILSPVKKKRGPGRPKKEILISGKPASKRKHQCDICGKFVSSKSNLKAHKICHTNLRPYKCTECSATFKGYSALFTHRRLHTGETPYHCQFCPKQFRRRTGLVLHVKTHTGERDFSCEICFKSFVQRAQLTIHMKRHNGDKAFLCQTCGKGFAIRGDLIVHQRIHNGEKPYKCTLCEKSFSTAGNLSIHIRIHKKEVRYHCKECHRGFVTCSSYNVHLKRHKGQRDYICECGKTFYTSSSLKQHKVVHTGEKKYHCKLCEKKFTQTSHLNRHFKKDHPKLNIPLPPSEQYKVQLTESKFDFHSLSESKAQDENSKRVN